MDAQSLMPAHPRRLLGCRSHIDRDIRKAHPDAEKQASRDVRTVGAARELGRRGPLERIERGAQNAQSTDGEDTEAGRGELATGSPVQAPPNHIG